MLILNFLPLYLTIFAANLVPAGRVWRWITIGLILAFDAVLALAGLLLLVAGPTLLRELVQAGGAGEAMANVSTVPSALLVLLTVLGSVLLLVPRVRPALIRLGRLALDPDDTVHLVAMTFALWLVGLTLAQLLLIGDLPVEVLAEGTELTLGALWEQGIAFVLFALLGVGLGLRRSAGETWERLGLRPLTWRQGAIVVGAIVLLTVWDALLSLGWQAADPASFERISRISETLFGGVMGPLGALTIGLSAGIGEELLFRGALQPRFGLLLATLLFTVGHTQYELSPALFSVFVIGLVLGILRQRESTTVTILIHAGYNALNVLLAPLWS